MKCDGSTGPADVPDDGLLFEVDDDGDEFQLGVCMFAYGFLAAQHAKASRKRKRGLYNVMKSKDSWSVLMGHNRAYFQRFNLRMSLESFDEIVSELRSDPIFTSRGKKSQKDVALQFAAFLQHHGTIHRPFLDISLKLDIGVGTISLYRQRIVQALFHLKKRFICWPRGPRKEAVKSAFGQYGFANAIGAIDGTLIPLYEMPRSQGWDYYSARKKIFCVSSKFQIMMSTDQPPCAAERLGERRSRGLLHVNRYRLARFGSRFLNLASMPYVGEA